GRRGGDGQVHQGGAGRRRAVVFVEFLVPGGAVGGGRGGYREKVHDDRFGRRTGGITGNVVGLQRDRAEDPFGHGLSVGVTLGQHTGIVVAALDQGREEERRRPAHGTRERQCVEGDLTRAGAAGARTDAQRF